ncbi:sialate O-acetylesterase [Flavisolibacter sp. BT320]|nr:sialate O-acetylesterase [Flavisolibacter longurius]
MKRLTFFLLFLAFVGAQKANAKIQLPPLIADGMVLQQQSRVSLWGWANKSAAITVTTSWNKKVYTTKSNASGEWKLKVETPAAGGPYFIVISDGTPVKLTDILIGEVWLCSGQSNMEMPVEGFRNQPILHASDILLAADNPKIRMIRFERAASMTPRDSVANTGWQHCTAESVRKFSAVGYQFASILQQQLGVPVGVIGTYWGGTMVEAWMSEKSLQPFPEVTIPADTVGKGKHAPSALFNAMVNPLVGYGIKGMLWYQGEQNRGNPGIYDQLLASMVKDWRERWQVGEFPFYYVQIAPFRYKDTMGPAAPFREAQQRALQHIPNAGMVVSLDVGEEGGIHPPDKSTISKRLACWALAKTYHRKGLPHASPLFSSMNITGNTATLRFENAANGLTAYGKPIVNFEMAGEDKVFYPAQARIVGEGIRLTSEKVTKPVAVRYGYKDWLAGEVYNTEGLPLAPFRTDR